MYYYTDKEELEAVKTENAKLTGMLADSIKECGKLNRVINEIKRVVFDHIIFNKDGSAKYIDAKPLLVLLEDKPNAKSDK